MGLWRETGELVDGEVELTPLKKVVSPSPTTGNKRVTKNKA